MTEHSVIRRATPEDTKDISALITPLLKKFTHPDDELPAWFCARYSSVNLEKQFDDKDRTCIVCEKDIEPQKGEGLNHLRIGLLRCAACHTRTRHELKWPDDAWWQWDIRGKTLWAYDLTHTRKLLEHIKSELRPARVDEELKHLPSHFLSAKVRPVITKKIEEVLKQ